jgi:hypothetical protein
MDEIRKQVTSDGIHTLFFGCITISDLRPEDARAFASARERQGLPRLPRAMPLSFFVDLASAIEGQSGPVRAAV